MGYEPATLGDLVRDTITGLQGIVVCRSEWLNGCVRLMVQPRDLREGKPVEAQIYDVEQLEVVQRGAMEWKYDSQDRAALRTGGPCEGEAKAMSR